MISTHALREEGDGGHGVGVSGCGISTHALREEGDLTPCNAIRTALISTHALREEGDPAAQLRADLCGEISTHALREEGDYISRTAALTVSRFLPTPSARRATTRPAD